MRKSEFPRSRKLECGMQEKKNDEKGIQQRMKYKAPHSRPIGQY
jgi:hypothetical protein